MPLGNIASIIGEEQEPAPQDPIELLNLGTANLLSLPGAKGSASTGLDLLREYAKRYLPDPVAMRVAQADAQRAYEEQAAALMEGSPASRAAPWLAFAAGMGQPTRTGNFAEAASNASASLVQQLNAQARDEALAQREAAILRSKGAALPAEAMQEELKVALPALSRMTAANKLTAGKRFQFQKSGSSVLVFDTETIDPATGGPKLVQKFDDALGMMTRLAQGVLKIAGDPNRMQFDKPEQAMEWTWAQVLDGAKRILGENAQPGAAEELAANAMRAAQGAPPPAAAAPGAAPGPITPPPPMPSPVPPMPPPAPPKLGALPPPGQPFHMTQPTPEAAKAQLAEFTARGIPAVVTVPGPGGAATPPPGVGAPMAPPAPPAPAVLGADLAEQNAREIARMPTPQPSLPPQPIPLSPIMRSFIPQAAPARGPRMVDPVARAGAVASAENEAKYVEKYYAEELVPATDVARSLMSNAKLWRSMGSETSRAAAIQEWLGAWSGALGLDNNMVKKAEKLQQLNKIMMQEVLRQQILQKGVQTEGDARRMAQAWAQLQNTPAANEFILRITEANAQRALERQQFFDTYREEHGGSIRGAQVAWNKYINSVPLVGSYKGNPLFYYEWVERAQKANPNIDPGTLQREWRKLTNG